jgi:tetratricopeptide (TPR) repeat protein
MDGKRWLVAVLVGLLLIGRSSLAEKPKSAAETAKKGELLQEKPSESDKAWAAYRSFCDQAEKYETQGDLDKAIGSWTNAIRHVPQQTVYPDIHGAFFSRAWLYGKKGDLDKAIADYSAAMRYDPWSVIPLCCRAGMYERKGELDKAIADYAKAIRLRSDNAYPFIGRARLYIKKGDLDKAIADCTESLRLKPDFAAAYDCRASAFLLKGEIDKAIADSTEAIRLDSKKAAFYEARSRAYAKKGDNHKVVEDHIGAVRLAGKSGSISLEVAPFQIVKNSDGFFVFADHRCSKYVPSINYRNVSASFSDAQSKEMAKTSLDKALFLRYIETQWPLSRLKTYCTKANRFPDGCQNLVGNWCFSEDLSVHKDRHDGFDKIYVYACHDDGMGGECSYAGSLMSDWRRWDYSLNMVRGKDHWVIIESLPNDFMDNPAKYLSGQTVQKK